MKNKLVLFFAVLLFFGVSSFYCFAQSSSNDQLIFGTWERIDSMGTTSRYIFNANGSGIFRTIYTAEMKNIGFSDSEIIFTYGISSNGEIRMVSQSLGRNDENGGRIFFSPDGTYFLGFDNTITVYRKR